MNGGVESGESAIKMQDHGVINIRKYQNTMLLIFFSKIIFGDGH